MLDRQRQKEVDEIKSFYDSVYYADAKPSASRALLRHYGRLHQRMGLGVIELGHSNTEAFGMEGLARLLREHFPDVPVEHIPAGDSFGYV